MSKKYYWSKMDCEYLKNNYHLKPAKEVAEFLDKPIKLVRGKAEREGLMSRTKTHRMLRTNHVELLIKHGERCIYTLSEKSGMFLTHIQGILDEYVINEEVIKKFKYFDTEQDILDSLNVQTEKDYYDPKELTGW